MPRSGRGHRGRISTEEDVGGLQVCESAIVFDDASSDDDEAKRRRRLKQKPMTRKATRKELRAVAPGGLLIEDVFQRIGFDDGLPDLSAFQVLVDQAEGEQRKWCSSFCWTSKCSLGKDCKYSHDGYHLRIWRPAAGLTPSRRIGIIPMEIKSLSAIRQDIGALQTVAYLLYNQEVVWGRDLGASNNEIWSSFVRGWQAPDGHLNLNGILVSIKNECPATHKTADSSDWSQLPEVVWLRVAQATAVEDLAAMAMALPYMSWQNVVDSFWPIYCHSAASHSGSHDGSRGVSAECVREVISLCVASRTVASLLRWPHAASGAESLGATGITGSSPLTNLMCNAGSMSPSFRPPERVSPVNPIQSPGALSPSFRPERNSLGAVGTAGSSPVANLVQSPVGLSQSLWAEQANPNCTSLIASMCPAIQDLLASSGEPVNIPVDTAVLEGGLCLDDSLIVLLCRGGGFRAIRRNDLKQVCGLIVREANCFHFQNELLVVGTSSPARLAAYDMSVPKPSRPLYQLRLDGGANIDVACTFFLDTCKLICGLQAEDQAALSEARIISCEDDGFVFLQRLTVESLSPLNLSYVTVVSEGMLSVWDLSSPVLESHMRTDLQFIDGHDSSTAPALATGCSARHVIVGGNSGSFAVHDLIKPGVEPVLLTIPKLGDVAGQTGAGSESELSLLDGSTLQWIVRSLHVHGSVLLAVAEQYGGDCVDSFFMFAWHLPTYRMLLSHQALPGHITAFSRVNSVKTNRTLAFAVSQPVGREGRIAHCVVLPGSNATKVRTGRSTGFTGPQRHKISSSDLRARRSGGMHKR